MKCKRERGAAIYDMRTDDAEVFPPSLMRSKQMQSCIYNIMYYVKSIYSAVGFRMYNAIKKNNNKKNDVLMQFQKAFIRSILLRTSSSILSSVKKILNTPLRYMMQLYYIIYDVHVDPESDRIASHPFSVRHTVMEKCIAF